MTDNLQSFCLAYNTENHSRKERIIMKGGFYNCCYQCVGKRSINCHATCTQYLEAKKQELLYKKKHPNYNSFYAERGWSYIHTRK